MFSILLYHKRNFHPVIELTGTSPEALIKQANGHQDHYSFSPRRISGMVLDTREKTAI